MSRALRRHYWGGYAYELSHTQLGKIIATPQPCRGVCCTNRRRIWNERTVQELRFECIDPSAE